MSPKSPKNVKPIKNRNKIKIQFSLFLSKCRFPEKNNLKNFNIKYPIRHHSKVHFIFLNVHLQKRNRKTENEKKKNAYYFIYLFFFFQL